MDTQDSVQKLADLYTNQISIPTHKPSRQFILCPIGFVGSGKTTVVKPLAEKLGLIRLSNDEIRLLLKENGYDYSQTRDIRNYLINKFVAEGFSLIIDSDCSNPSTYEFLTNISDASNIPLVWIHIDPPEEFILNKLKNLKYNERGMFRDSEQAIRNYYSARHEREEGNNLAKVIPFLYTFDTSRPDLNEQISDAIEKIKETTGN